MSQKDGKTEKATPQRRRKAKEEGQVARSQEVAVATSFVAMVLVLAVGGRSMVERSMQELSVTFTTIDSPEALGQSGLRAASLFLILAGPFLAAAVVAGVAAGAAQVGLKFNVKLAKPKMNRLSPKQGLEKLKPGQASWELFRAVLKLSAVAAVVYPTVAAWRDHLANDRTLAGAIDRLTGAYGGVIVRAAILALIIALADFAYQKRKSDKKMMMSRQDIKREFRDSEGDPYQKAARRRRASELSRNRMMADVATADVLVANPTHLVVALRYDPDEGAPRVVAKGGDLVADRLKEVARRHGVPITTDIPLARALFKQCQVGHFVPSALYEAVAVVLAHAYRRTGRGPGSRLPSGVA
ncbi:MAG: EscU/YscU/HrcU family type III secretion system export apparatus switch protein [Nitriliruptoraceae bacterium]|nr:EscU/YscU/HrcU family type III secretion system export apparatus switch protein [Nitriliruptoraceae bacterium]